MIKVKLKFYVIFLKRKASKPLPYKPVGNKQANYLTTRQRKKLLQRRVLLDIPKNRSTSLLNIKRDVYYSFNLPV